MAPPAPPGAVGASPRSHSITMPSKARIPEALDRHLRNATGDSSIPVAAYIERGSALVTPEAIQALGSFLPAIRTRLAGLADTEPVRRSLSLLLLYFEETAARSAAEATRRDAAFALLYFLKGYDSVPDNLPEIGLLDDAIIASTVIQRNQPALRAHWRERGRTWPAGL